MIATEKQENAEFVKDSVAYLENKGFENIKADIEGYETPKSFRQQGTDTLIIPDISAERAGIQHYFEISLKSDKPNELKTKWRLLDVVTRMNKQRFKIITTRGHYKFTNEMLDDLNLKKNLIKI